MADPQFKMCMMGSENPTTWIIYNHLIQEFGLFPAIIEESVSRRALLRNRVKKLGFLKVASQVAFVLVIRPLLVWRYKTRIKEICQISGLERTAPLSHAITHVSSVNSPEAQQKIQALAPTVIIVNGTRIITSQTLAATKASFINVHQGITPLYRGAHGAYWALLNNDLAQCGVTVHLVDQGIDTGNIVDHVLISPTDQDSFVTYPYLQTAAALPALSLAIKKILAGELQTQPISGTSKVWYHPGFVQYIMGWLRGIR